VTLYMLNLTFYHIFIGHYISPPLTFVS